MKNEMRVKYLFINLKYPSYIKLQAILIIALLSGAILTYFFAHDSQFWFLRNGPWFYPIIALLEVGEAYIAIRKAKKTFNEQPDASSA